MASVVAHSISSPTSPAGVNKLELDRIFYWLPASTLFKYLASLIYACQQFKTAGVRVILELGCLNSSKINCIEHGEFGKYYAPRWINLLVNQRISQVFLICSIII